MIRKILWLVFALAFSLIVTGCQSAVVEDSKESITDKFNQVKESIVESKSQQTLLTEGFMDYANDLAYKSVTMSPLQSSFTFGDLEKEGLTELMYQLDDVSVEGIEADMAVVRDMLEGLEQYDYDALNDYEKMIYDMLVFQLDSAIESEPYLYYANNFNPSMGIQISMPLTLAQVELESPLEVEAYLERLKRLPDLFDGAIKLEYIKGEKELLLQPYLYDLTIEQIDSLTTSVEDFVIYQSFCDQMDQVDFLTDEEKNDSKKLCYDIVEGPIFDSYSRMKSDLAQIRDMSDNTNGTSEFNKSKKYYEWLLYSKTSYDYSIEAMEAFIQSEWDKYFSIYENIIKENPELLDNIEKEMATENFATIEEALLSARAITDEMFFDYGVESAEQKIIPAYLAEHMPAGFYFVTSIDGEDYGNMYLKEDYYEEIDLEGYSTLLHENIPGHHFYFTVLYESDKSLIQKLGDWDTYSEGYAVHVQNLAYKDQIDNEVIIDYLDAFFRISYLNELQTDINVHVHGMSKEQFVEFKSQQGLPEEYAQKQYNRMITNPGEVFEYYFGYMKIESYNQLFKDFMKEEYDVKEFHDFLLNHANIPFSTMDYVVEDYLNSWYDKRN